MTELFGAIRSRDMRALERAADRGAPLNDFHAGLTPLGLAAEKGFVEAVTYLLGLAGIEPNKGRPDGSSPLMIAAEENKVGVVEAMLGYPDVAINHADSEGETALLLAIQADATEAALALLADRTLDKEKMNKERFTPLLAAATSGNAVIVEALLQRGANPAYKRDLTTIAELGKGRRFAPVINQMLINWTEYGRTYNSPVADEGKVPLASLDNVKINIFQMKPTAEEFLTGSDMRTPYPVIVNTKAEATRFFPEFKRMMHLARGLCAGLDHTYAIRRMGAIDFYILLTYSAPEKLGGFVYITLNPSRKDFFIDLICARNSVKGTGTFLMDYCIQLATSKGYTKISLESVEGARTFYERYGFAYGERRAGMIKSGLYPMSRDLAAAPAATAKNRRSNGKGKAKKTLKKRASKKGAGAGAGANE
jgi:hypothetical protein